MSGVVRVTGVSSCVRGLVCDVGDGEGAVGEDGDLGIGAELLEFLVDGGFDVLAGGEVDGVKRFRGEGAMDHDAGVLLDLSEDLGLPLFGEVVSGLGEAVEEGMGIGVGAEELVEGAIGGDAFTAFASEDEESSGADDACGGAEAFDALVEVEVQGVAAVAGNDDVVGVGDGLHGGVFDEGGSLLMGGEEVACEDAGDGALVIEGDVEEEAGAWALGDVVEFLPEWIAVSDTEGGVGVADIPGAVVAHDGMESAASGNDAFGAAAESGEEVGFDEAGDDADISLDEVTVEECGCAVASGAELDECIGVFRFVVEDVVASDYFGGEESFEFGVGVGSMGAELVDECDVVGRNVMQVLEQPGDEAVVGGGAGDVAKRDADFGTGLDPITKGRAVDGMFEGVEDGGFFVG